jgi:two-component system sensor histidine kinase CiaH
MFRSATFRLTLSYLGILMSISILFSVVLYNISAHEIHTDLRRQLPYFQQYQMDDSFGQGFQGYVLQQETISEHRLQLQLILVNLVILVAAGAASYWLARRSLRPIEDALEAQSRFTADASHELRTPLTAMKSEIEVALRNPKLSPIDTREVLVSNLEEISKLEALSNGLLRLAQHGNEDGESFAPVSLAKISSDAVTRMETAIRRRPVTVYNEVEPTIVWGDAQHLTEVLAILLDNAIKYSPPKSPITLSSHVQGNFAYLEVKDEGLGIDELDLPHIFDRFYRAESSRTKEQTGGYGLGLSIAQKISELHGGSIEASSEVGKGSIFTIKLPFSNLA